MLEGSLSCRNIRRCGLDMVRTLPEMRKGTVGHNIAHGRSAHCLNRPFFYNSIKRNVHIPFPLNHMVKILVESCCKLIMLMERMGMGVAHARIREAVLRQTLH